jgi:hypothetical protein
MNIIPAPSPPNWAPVIADEFQFLARTGAFEVDALTLSGALVLRAFADSILQVSQALTISGLPLTLRGGGITLQATNLPSAILLNAGAGPGGAQFNLPTVGPARLSTPYGVDIESTSGDGNVHLHATAAGILLDTDNSDITLAPGGGWSVLLGGDGEGPVLFSPNGTRYRVNVTDAGALQVVPA